MKVLLMSLGSRGDMEPFLALGQELLEQGHDVGFCMPFQFESLAREVSTQFFPQDRSFIELIEGPEIRKIMGQVGSGWSRLRTMAGLAKKTKPIQQQLIRDQASAVAAFAPDEVVFHIKCIYPVLYALRLEGKVRMLSPMPCLVHPTSRHPHIAFGRPRAGWWNRLTYALAEKALVHQSILGYGASFLEEKGWKLRAAEIQKFYRDACPVEYAYEEAMFKRPEDWPPQAEITHFRERKKPVDGRWLDELESFFATHEHVIYVGFGSMVNSRPQQVAEDILAVCSEAGLSVVMNRSWGGIEPPERLPSHAYVVDDVPFEVLFPRVKAAVHHGGSGTTHSALSCQTMQAIIPHIADQFFWSRQVVAAGAGVPGFPIKHWSRERFARLVAALKNEFK
jgi:sterol 3beta-glucosyltransferase